MFRIIVLHESVCLKVVQVGYQCLVQNVHKWFFVHSPFKDADPSCSLEADSSLDIDFDRVLCPNNDGK